MSEAEAAHGGGYRRLAYRGDIDGLRAVAVGGVLVSHVAPGVLPGGFLGVDVFFVISGYLIFGLLLKNHRAGTLSLRTFYARRVQRIVPLASTVVLVCLVVGWWCLYPHELDRLGQEALGAAGMFANVFYFFNSGYFDPDAHLRPFLHYWSLGVEEQFYLLFPLTLLLFWRGRWPLRVLLGGVGLLSFVLNVVVVLDHAQAAFYLLPTRAWEFVLGAGVALWHAEGRASVSSPMRASMLRGTGLVLIGVSFYAVAPWDPVPGVLALAPTLGAAMVCLAHHPDRGSWVLDNVAARHVGQLSYGIYLWHWPVLYFLRVSDESFLQPRPAVAGLVVVGAWGLAALTHRLVETPARKGRGLLGRPPRVLGLVAVTLVAGALAASAWVPPRRAGTAARLLAEASRDWHPFDGMQTRMEKDMRVATRRGGVPGTVLYLGDSNMEHFAPRVSAVMDEHPENVHSAVFVTLGSCRPIPQVTDRARPACLQLWDVADQMMQEHDVVRVVLGGRWHLGFRSAALVLVEDGRKHPMDDPAVRARALALLTARIKALRAAGKEVFFLHNAPSSPTLRKLSPAKLRWIPHAGEEIELRSRVPRDSTLDPIGRRELSAMVAESGARSIDPIAVMCDAFCPVTDEEGVPIYLDAGHIRAGYARTRATFMDQTILADEPASP